MNTPSGGGESPSEARLDELRTQLGEVDREFITLVARRMRLASEIGSVKRAGEMPTRNYDQEAEVIARARAACDAIGVPPHVAEELMLLLIRSSLTVQEQDSVAASRQGVGKRVLVIGGSGRMGRWMVRFLDSQGYRVEIVDPAGAVDGHVHHGRLDGVTLDHDVIIVAAPLGISNDILLDLAARKPSGLVFDIGSLKSPVRRGLMACVGEGLEVTSIHPMFGPDTRLLTNRHVIIVDLGVPSANSRVRDLFASTMVDQVEMDLDKHDRLIAYILGLSHAFNIAFLAVLAQSGEAAKDLAQLSSTTFDAQFQVAAAVVQDNPGLYFEIQHLNAFGTESLDALSAAVDQVRSVVSAGDEVGFTALMEQGRAYARGRELSRRR
jgi:chorismate mutase/prephenate dehydrogenase